jgi:hypothetical protein
MSKLCFAPRLAISRLPTDSLALHGKMDVGVGSFVFALGIIGARPFLAPPDSAASKAKLWSSFVRSVKKSAPTLLLGLFRVAMVKGVEYPVRLPLTLLSRSRSSR